MTGFYWFLVLIIAVMKITLVPRAGLCNRLNAILSGLGYLEKHQDVELKIIWIKWPTCNCHFKDLFKQLPNSYPKVKEFSFQFIDLPGHRFNMFIPDMLRKIWYDYSFSPSPDLADKFDDICKNKNNIYVGRGNRWCSELITTSLAKIFQPTDELQLRINNITSNWENKNVIGLHIRRTDNSESIKRSPIEHFYEVIEKEIEKNEDVFFYVASDDDTVKLDLHNRYGARIISMPFCLKRNSVKGMKDAVVDLYCLGSTQKIYGSHWSTYSDFAARLFNIEVIR